MKRERDRKRLQQVLIIKDTGEGYGKTEIEKRLAKISTKFGNVNSIVKYRCIKQKKHIDIIDRKKEREASEKQSQRRDLGSFKECEWVGRRDTYIERQR